jgi:hypothetical protein
MTIVLDLVGGLANAAESPWSRFFNHPPVSTQQGEQLAMSKALSSVFNPLKLKAKDDNLPVFPQLSESPFPLLMVQGLPPMAIVPCSVPLLEAKAEGQFFVNSMPANSALDPEVFRAVPYAPCK